MDDRNSYSGDSDQHDELSESFNAVVRILTDAAAIEETLAKLNPALEALRLMQYALAVDGLALTEARSFTALVGLETSDAWSSGHPDLVFVLARRLSEQVATTDGTEDLKELYRRFGAISWKADSGALDTFHSAIERLLKAACRIDGIQSDKEEQLLDKLSEMRRAAKA